MLACRPKRIWHYSKLKLPSILVVFLVLISTVAACRKKAAAPDCGCGSTIIDTLTNIVGNLSYNTSLKGYTVSTLGFSGYTDNVICNTDFSALLLIEDSAKNNTIRVTFSGYQMNYCRLSSVAYVDQPYTIELTQLTYQ
jgi:hypothetical protein